jgi:phosphohistidine phosphatase SixA
MKIFLIRHGKSDKSLKDKLPHDEFELKRGLVEGEEDKAFQLGQTLKNQLSDTAGYDLVCSGKVRSQQTVLAVAKGLGLSEEEGKKALREDFGLVYLADQEYWEAAETAVKDNTSPSHADFFLNNPPQEFFAKHNVTQPGQTFSASHMRQNMRSVLRRSIERNIFREIETVVMVSHEPVLSLCMSDLTGKSVSELGGSFSELEYAVFTINTEHQDQPYRTELQFRGDAYEVSSKV